MGRKLWVFLALVMVVAALRLGAQDTLGSRITNAGAVRANAATDSVFISRTRLADTVDIGDFASAMLARIGAPPFDDSLGFRVFSDGRSIRIRGRLMDFPPDSRAELGPIFSFLDSTSVWEAQISMPQRDSGIMRFRLDRVTVRGFPIPDLLLLAAVSQYSKRYPGMLQAGGRAFDVGMPKEAKVSLITNGIVLKMPPKP
ncbi:MAG TPA: hypothetical protein VGM20_15170 [Gemmatimonadales bacterium]|jgi:hypothetical protein